MTEKIRKLFEPKTAKKMKGSIPPEPPTLNPIPMSKGAEKLSERIFVVLNGEWGHSTKSEIYLPDWAKEIINDVKALEAERDTLAETLKKIDLMRTENLDRAIKAEAEVKTLTDDLAVCSESYEALRLHTWGKNSAEARLAKAQELLPYFKEHGDSLSEEFGGRDFNYDENVFRLKKSLGNERCKLYGTEKCSGVSCYAKPDWRCKSFKKALGDE